MVADGVGKKKKKKNSMPTKQPKESVWRESQASSGRPKKKKKNCSTFLSLPSITTSSPSSLSLPVLGREPQPGRDPRAHRVELLHLVLSQPPPHAARGRRRLFSALDARDRQRALGQAPVERDLRRGLRGGPPVVGVRLAHGAHQGDEGSHLGDARRGDGGRPRAAGEGRRGAALLAFSPFGMVLAGEQTLRQRGVGDDGDAVGLAGRDDVVGLRLRQKKLSFVFSFSGFFR